MDLGSYCATALHASAPTIKLPFVYVKMANAAGDVDLIGILNETPGERRGLPRPGVT